MFVFLHIDHCDISQRHCVSKMVNTEYAICTRGCAAKVIRQSVIEIRCGRTTIATQSVPLPFHQHRRKSNCKFCVSSDTQHWAPHRVVMHVDHTIAAHNDCTKRTILLMIANNNVECEIVNNDDCHPFIVIIIAIRMANAV